MPIMKSYLSNSDKLASVRDNFDEEISDDIDDDVFIRDGKISKNLEDKRLKRPLMPPKRIRFNNQKFNQNSVPNLLKKRTKCWKYCEPLCYGFIAIVILLAFIFLAAILLMMFPTPIQKFKIWFKKDPIMYNNYDSKNNVNYNSSNNIYNKNVEIVPCTQISVHKIWSKAISRINSETPLRKVDLNNDKIDDVVIGYGIDEFFQYSDIKAPRCQLGKYEETIICEGGLLAFNGETGDTLWQRWTTFTIFSLYCLVDLTQDGQIDCIAAGRGGLMIAVDGKNGNLIWQFSETLDLEVLTNQYFIDLYTVNPVRDLNGDSISDIITVHVEETPESKSGHIKLISGATGKVIRTIPTPKREEVFVPLQIITQLDGTESLLIVTGGQNTPGGLYTIRLNSLMQATTENDFITIFHSDSSGFMVPAVLTDLNFDNVEDIIISSFNSTVYAFDGKTYKIIWSYSFPTSETVSSIVPGYFDNDNVTDFLVKYNTGPGFPVYYYSQTTVLNGVDGKPLLDDMITDSGGPNSLLGGISISQNSGGDIFLHWQTECRGKSDSKDAYRFLPDSDIIQQSRADTCLLRFNTSTVLKLYALSRHLEPPGKLIFSTDDLILQLNQTFQKYMKQNTNPITPIKHPKMRLKTVEKNKEKLKSTSRETLNQNQNNNIEKNKKNKNDDNNNNNNNNNNINKKDKINNEINKTITSKIYNTENNDINEDDINNEQTLDSRKMISIEGNNMMKEEKPYIYLPYDDRERPFKNLQNTFNQQKDIPSDYDLLYDESLQPIIRNRNHGIRRSSSNKKENNTKTKAFNNEANRETLWDLEIEKENAESLNDNNYDYQAKQKRDSYYNNQNLLPSISSTGVIVNSLKISEDSMDYIFVLNVRESELYPPLYLAEDVECIENKMRNIPSYMETNLLSVEKEFLTECLQKRIPNISQPAQQQYETQIVITRINIKCNCENLNKNEVCSKFNSIGNQKWTGFMGNNGNGLFPN